MKPDRWVVIEADPSGNAGEVFRTASPYRALAELNRLRFVAPSLGKSNRVYGVHDAENEERGDVQMELEEIVFNDPEQGARYEVEESYRLLTAAASHALDEIVERGIVIGRSMEDGSYRWKDAPSIFDAVNAYYVARRAREVADAERMRPR